MITAENVHAFEVAGRRWFIRFSREMPVDDEGHKTNVLVDYGARTITACREIMPLDMATFIAADYAWRYWSKRRLREVIDAQGPAPDYSTPERKRDAKRCKAKQEPIVKPGELLPADEREAVKQQADEALRKIMQQPDGPVES